MFIAATVLENKWKAVAKCNQYRSPYIGLLYSYSCYNRIFKGDM